MTRIKVQTTIRAPLQTVFDAARDAAMHTKTTSHTREKIVGGRACGLFEQGDEITFEATHFFVRQRLTARVFEMNPPHGFSDEMVRGTFKSLRHEHRFETVKYGTLMTDILQFSAPLGVLGTIAEWLFLKRYMTQFLKRRNAVMKRLLETPTP